MHVEAQSETVTRRAGVVSNYRRYLAAHPDGGDAVAARNAIDALQESP